MSNIFANCRPMINIPNRWFESSIYSEDKRFQLFFKPVRLMFRFDPMDNPIDAKDEVGLYLLKKKEGNRNIYENEIFIDCVDGDWYNAECRMLRAVEEMPYSEEDKDYISNFIWNEITSQKRVVFEKEGTDNGSQG